MANSQVKVWLPQWQEVAAHRAEAALGVFTGRHDWYDWGAAQRDTVHCGPD